MIKYWLDKDKTCRYCNNNYRHKKVRRNKMAKENGEKLTSKARSPIIKETQNK